MQNQSTVTKNPGQKVSEVAICSSSGTPTEGSLESQLTCLERLTQIGAVYAFAASFEEHTASRLLAGAQTNLVEVGR